MSEIKADELEHIAYMQTLEIQKLTACIAELEMEVTKGHELQDELTARIAELYPAVGLMTTLKPTMVMDAEHPLEMAIEVVEHVTARIAELEAEVTVRKEHATKLLENIEKLDAIGQRQFSRIAELEEFIGKLIEAGESEDSPMPAVWLELVNDWKEREG